MTETDDDAARRAERERLDQMRVTDPSRKRKFDARHLASSGNMPRTAPERRRARDERAPELDDKRALAALYYGGTPIAPTGLTQQELAALLNTSAPVVSRAMQRLGIHPPRSVHQRRAQASRRDDDDPPARAVDAGVPRQDELRRVYAECFDPDDDDARFDLDRAEGDD